MAYEDVDWTRFVEIRGWLGAACGIVVTEAFSFLIDGKFTDQLSVCHV